MRSYQQNVSIYSFGLVLLAVSAFLIPRALHAADRITVSPGDNLRSLVESSPEGTTFIFQPGLYRTADFVPSSLAESDSYAIQPKKGDIFIGKSGAILSGAKEVTDWQQSNGYWVSRGHTEALWSLDVSGRSECTSINQNCNQPHDLYVDGTRLISVDARNKVGSGKWYFDYGANEIVVSSDLRGHVVELGSVTHAFYARGVVDVEIKGFIMEKFVTAIEALSKFPVTPDWLIEQNEFRYNHEYGATVSAGIIFRNNYSHHNGRGGAKGWLSNDVLLEGNEFAYNNKEAWSNHGNAAGGAKFGDSRDITFRGNYAHDNHGPGLWTDVRSEDVLYEGNISVDNFKEGIVHEIGYSAIIRGNIVRGNEDNQIELRNSRDGEVYNNIVFVSAMGGDGITVRGNFRLQPEGVPYLVTNNVVRNNEIIYEGSSGTSGLRMGCANGSTCNPEDYLQVWNSNSFSNNNYYTSSTRRAWRSGPALDGRLLFNFSEFRATGQGVGGEILGGSKKSSGFDTPRISITSPSSQEDGEGEITLSARVSGVEEGDIISVVRFYIDGKKIGQDSYAPYSIGWYTPTDGSHTLRVEAVTLHDAYRVQDTKTFSVSSVDAEPPVVEQTPYKIYTVPTIIQAEDYDRGGQNISYYDKTVGNTGGAYRTDDVDIKATAEGGYAVGWLEGGEWMEYTFSTPSNGIYDIWARVGSLNVGRTFGIRIDGTSIQSDVSVPATQDWDQYGTVFAGRTTLSAGSHILRFILGEKNYIDLNWIKVEHVNDDTSPPQGGGGTSGGGGGGTGSPVPPPAGQDEHVPPSPRGSSGGGGGGSAVDRIRVTDASSPQVSVGCTFIRNLTLGSSGTDVSCLQRFLQSSGHYTYAGGITGYFGSVTQEALASWQRAKGINPPQGFFGSLSRAAYSKEGGGTTSSSRESILARIQELLAIVQTLQKQLALQRGAEIPPSPSIQSPSIQYVQVPTTCSYTRNLTLGSSGTDVSCLQRFLQSSGHYTYAGGITGYFGSVTQEALASWQRANSIEPANGQFDPITRSAVRLLSK